jgi:integrase
MRAIDSAVGERNNGPLLARGDGSRLDRHAAGRIVRRLAKRAGIDKAISPHSLRHAAIAAALDAGCSLRDVQDFALYADPRQTRRYDRARRALHRNPAGPRATTRRYPRAMLGFRAKGVAGLRSRLRPVGSPLRGERREGRRPGGRVCGGAG